MSKTEKINKKLNRPLNMVLGLSDNQLDLEDVKWEEGIGWVGQMSGQKYKDMRDAMILVRKLKSHHLWSLKKNNLI